MEVFNVEKTDLNIRTETTTVERFSKAINLETIFDGRGNITFNTICVSRPGLQLTGYFKHFANSRVQLIGNAEFEYLSSMPAAAKERNVEEIFRREIPCVIIANNLGVEPTLLKYAKKYNCPMFLSKQNSAVLAHELIMFLSDLLAPTTMIQGVFVEVFGVGILLTGKAGIGKSETALELITRGHRLIADDSVIVKNLGDELIGKPPLNIRYFMEVRGIGIINVQKMYGPGSVRQNKEVDMVVELVKWEDGGEYVRLGDVKNTEDLLGISVPKLVIPVCPGRNIPVIIESAARKYRLDETGYDATKDLISRTFPKNK